MISSFFFLFPLGAYTYFLNQFLFFTNVINNLLTFLFNSPFVPLFIGTLFLFFLYMVSSHSFFFLTMITRTLLSTLFSSFVFIFFTYQQYNIFFFINHKKLYSPELRNNVFLVLSLIHSEPLVQAFCFTLTLSLGHSFIHSHSVTRSFIHPCTPSLIQLLFHALIQSLIQVIVYSFLYKLTLPFSHSLSPSLIQPFFFHSFISSLAPAISPSLSCSLTPSLIHFPHPFPESLTKLFT